MIDLKKLKPVGVIVILGCALLALIVCFTADMGIPDRVTLRHDAAYYAESAEHLAELEEELADGLFPQLTDVREHHVDPVSMRLVITVGAKSYGKAKAALERDVDASLFELISEK